MPDSHQTAKQNNKNDRHKANCHINCTDMVFHQYVFFDAVLDDHFEQSFYQIYCIDMVSLQCVFWCFTREPFWVKLFSHWYGFSQVCILWCRARPSFPIKAFGTMVSLQCVVWCFTRKPFWVNGHSSLMSTSIRDCRWLPIPEGCPCNLVHRSRRS